MRLEASGTFQLLSVTVIPPPVAFLRPCTLLGRFGVLAFEPLLLSEILDLLILDTFLQMALDALDTLKLIEGLL